ncbi:hypothetical protein SDC9_205548 [bioreactor metagenome]|uniref:Uncharacterized protein n=1 Tax=bioreactor metagenome TaxID=1076179 RepID=A0A645J415_9ZZZZ
MGRIRKPGAFDEQLIDVLLRKADQRLDELAFQAGAEYRAVLDLDHRDVLFADQRAVDVDLAKIVDEHAYARRIAALQDSLQ